MKRYAKLNPLISILNDYLKDSPAPISLSYLWNFGSLLGITLVSQIVTGISLSFHYQPSIELAFESVESIMRDVNYGWLLRYWHSNGAGIFFIIVYLHLGRNLYYGSYNRPRIILWFAGVIIFLLMIITAFLGYVLVWGSMSLWGAVVITNLLSAIPWIGTDLVYFIWGGYSVDNPTLNRFYGLHFLLPFVIVAIVMIHLIGLHQHASNNPPGLGSNMDRIPFHPYYTYKDSLGFVVLFLLFMFLVIYKPNLLGHPDNYIQANPMVTPSSIVPEFYLLPFYAILRSIPDKLLGVIAMIFSILGLLLLPFLNVSPIRSNMFRPLNRVLFFIFVLCFLLLMYLGAAPVEFPYVLLSRICCAYYFIYLFVIPVILGLIEREVWRNPSILYKS